MLSKQITFIGSQMVLACDGKCNKAWGINNRPALQLSENEDDFEYSSDDELGEAPVHPGTTEGGHAKPTRPEEMLNKWCARECERSHMSFLNEDIVLPDFSKRIRNIPTDADD